MGLTNYLLVIILLILVRQFYPTFLDAILPLAIGGLALYGCYWLVVKFPAKWKKRTAERQREEKDEAEFMAYQIKQAAIRAKYDPKHEWNEGTSLPRAYSDEMRKLVIENQGMLRRRNGWTDDDFDY